MRRRAMDSESRQGRKASGRRGDDGLASSLISWRTVGAEREREGKGGASRRRRRGEKRTVDASAKRQAYQLEMPASVYLPLKHTFSASLLIGRRKCLTCIPSSLTGIDVLILRFAKAL